MEPRPTRVEGEPKINEKRNTFSIETDYKDKEMRSRLEARTAFLLDQLEIKWEYEEHQIFLSTGEIYIPDFYLPEREKWIECKGDLEDPSIKKAEQLAKDREQELLLISQNDSRHYRSVPKEGIDESKVTHLVKCSKCGDYSFVPNLGSWHCRKCNHHNGDHDIVSYDVFGDSWVGSPRLEIKSGDEIKDFLAEVQ